MNTILEIYNTLFNHFGKQFWWPAETPFEVMVGAILTQNTSWKNVEKTIKLLKEKNLLDPQVMILKRDEELAMLIKSSGFYNIKAKRLKNFLSFFECYNFDIERLRADNFLREKLLGIKGIGKETADSILLYALDIPSFVVDAYTKRIFYRLGFLNATNISYDNVQQLFHNSLPKDIDIFKEFHALIVELAKNYCKKNPSCARCPLSKRCVFFKLISNKKNIPKHSSIGVLNE